MNEPESSRNKPPDQASAPGLTLSNETSLCDYVFGGGADRDSRTQSTKITNSRPLWQSDATSGSEPFWAPWCIARSVLWSTIRNHSLVQSGFFMECTEGGGRINAEIHTLPLLHSAIGIS